MSKENYASNSDDSVRWANVVVVSLPLVRLLKLIRRFEKFQLLIKAWKLAYEALPVLIFTLFMIAFFFAVCIYFVEPHDNIDSLPTALYFIIVTMTTVGYGDIVPTTVGGNCVILVLMIVSSLYMAIPIGVLGSAFSEVWGNRDRLLLIHRMRDAFLQEGYSAESMSKIVDLFDEDGDGELAIDEFSSMLKHMHIKMSDERVLMLHESIDKDGGGTINVGELINCLFPKLYTNLWRDMAQSAGFVSNLVGIESMTTRTSAFRAKEADLTAVEGDAMRTTGSATSRSSHCSNMSTMRIDEEDEQDPATKGGEAQEHDPDGKAEALDRSDVC